MNKMQCGVLLAKNLISIATLYIRVSTNNKYIEISSFDLSSYLLHSYSFNFEVSFRALDSFSDFQLVVEIGQH